MKIKMVTNMESQLYGPTEKEVKEQSESEHALKKMIGRNPVMRATLTAEYEASHPRHRDDTRAILLEGCHEARRVEVFAHTGVEEGLNFQDQMKNLRHPRQKKSSCKHHNSPKRRESIIRKASTTISPRAPRLSVLKASQTQKGIHEEHKDDVGVDNGDIFPPENPGVAADGHEPTANQSPEAPADDADPLQATEELDAHCCTSLRVPNASRPTRTNQTKAILLQHSLTSVSDSKKPGPTSIKLINDLLNQNIPIKPIKLKTTKKKLQLNEEIQIPLELKNYMELNFEDDLEDLSLQEVRHSVETVYIEPFKRHLR